MHPPHTLPLVQEPKYRVQELQRVCSSQVLMKGCGACGARQRCPPSRDMDAAGNSVFKNQLPHLALEGSLDLPAEKLRSIYNLPGLGDSPLGNSPHR